MKKNRTADEAHGNSYGFHSFFLTLLIIFSPACVYTQVKVNGTVTDIKGSPLEGTSVTVKGTSNGTVTDNEGHFSIVVPSHGNVLVFTSSGFTSKEVTIGAQTTIKVTLIETNNSLDEVVVIGYGTQKKRDVTGAITSVSAKQIQECQAVNLEDALQGQAAGVLVINDAGEPGATGTIQIKGGSTFSSAGNVPLGMFPNQYREELDILYRLKPLFFK